MQLLCKNNFLESPYPRPIRTVENILYRMPRLISIGIAVIVAEKIHVFIQLRYTSNRAFHGPYGCKLDRHCRMSREEKLAAFCNWIKPRLTVRRTTDRSSARLELVLTPLLDWWQFYMGNSRTRFDLSTTTETVRSLFGNLPRLVTRDWRLIISRCSNTRVAVSKTARPLPTANHGARTHTKERERGSLQNRFADSSSSISGDGSRN